MHQWIAFFQEWACSMRRLLRCVALECTQVTVTEVKPVKRQGEFLLRHIAKFDEIVRDLNRPLPLPADIGARPPVATY
jgi:hypothetical protein